MLSRLVLSPPGSRAKLPWNPRLAADKIRQLGDDAAGLLGGEERPTCLSRHQAAILSRWQVSQRDAPWSR
jgi:hypothetical protein